MFLKTVIHMGKNNVLQREISAAGAAGISTTDLTICFKHCHGTMMIESSSEQMDKMKSKPFFRIFLTLTKQIYRGLNDTLLKGKIYMHIQL